MKNSTLARSYNPSNAHVFESGLRISLSKLEKYKKSSGKLHDIICTTNLSNAICGTLDAIIMKEDPNYIPKKPVPPPIANTVADVKYIKKPTTEEQAIRKRSSLGEIKSEINVESEMIKLEARLGSTKPKRKGFSLFKSKKKKQEKEMNEEASFTSSITNGTLLNESSITVTSTTTAIETNRNLNVIEPIEPEKVVAPVTRGPQEWLESPVSANSGELDEFMIHLNDSFGSLDLQTMEQSGQESKSKKQSKMKDSVPSPVIELPLVARVSSPTPSEESSPKTPKRVSPIPDRITTLVDETRPNRRPVSMSVPPPKVSAKGSLVTPAPQMMSKPAGPVVSKINTDVSMTRTVSAPGIHSPKASTHMRSKSAEIVSPVHQIHSSVPSRKALKVLGLMDSEPAQKRMSSPPALVSPVSPVEKVNRKPTDQKALEVLGIVASKPSQVKRKPVPSKIIVPTTTVPVQRTVSNPVESHGNYPIAVPVQRTVSNPPVLMTGNHRQRTPVSAPPLTRTTSPTSMTQVTSPTAISQIHSPVSPVDRPKIHSDQKAMKLLGIEPNRPKRFAPQMAKQVPHTVVYQEQQGRMYDAHGVNRVPVYQHQGVPTPVYAKRMSAPQHQLSAPQQYQKQPPVVFQSSPSRMQPQSRVPPISTKVYSIQNGIPRPQSMHIPHHPTPPPMQRSFTNPIIYQERDPGRFPTFAKPTTRYAQPEPVQLPQQISSPQPMISPEDSEAKAQQRHMIYLKHLNRRSESTILYTHNNQPMLSERYQSHPQLIQPDRYHQQYHQPYGTPMQQKHSSMIIPPRPQIPSRTISLTEMKKEFKQ